MVTSRCAVCAQVTRKKDIVVCDPKDINLSLLCNEHLPDECLPSTYNLQAYQEAILYPVALHDCTRLHAFDCCTSCCKVLGKNNQPVAHATRVSRVCGLRASCVSWATPPTHPLSTSFISTTLILFLGDADNDNDTRITTTRINHISRPLAHNAASPSLVRSSSSLRSLVLLCYRFTYLRLPTDMHI
jgi:hypothetical protein